MLLNMSTDSLLADVLQLDAEQRLLFIEKVWESLRSNPSLVPMTDAQRQDLRRRLDEYQQDPSGNVSWEEVKRQVRARKQA